MGRSIRLPAPILATLQMIAIEIAVDNVTYLDGKSEKPKVRAWRL
jgi:hypothetical protein